MVEKFTQLDYQHLKKNGFNPEICTDCRRIDLTLLELTSNPVYVSAPKMRCPRCGKRLKIITLRGIKWHTHIYSMYHIMHDKPMCDYSERLTLTTILESEVSK